MSVDTPEDLAITEEWLASKKLLIRVSQLPAVRKALWHGLCRGLGRKAVVLKYKSDDPLFRYWVWRGHLSIGRLL